MERKLRRYQNLLDCVGTGVIMFGFWSMIKGVMTMILSVDELKMVAEDLGVPPEDMPIVMPAMMISIAVMVSVDMVLRLIAGLSARMEARNRDEKERRAHLVLAVVLGILSLLSLTADVSQLQYGRTIEIAMDAIITAVIDITSIVMIVELLVASVQVKRLKKKIGEAKAGEVAA